MRFSDKLSTGILIMILLAGCGGTIPSTNATNNLIPTAVTPEPTLAGIYTSILPTVTNPLAATKTIQSTNVPTPVHGKLPIGPGVEWHLVVISESSGWGLGAAYASQIEKDTGVVVTLNDFAIGNLSAAFVLSALQPGTGSNSNMGDWAIALMNADVVVLNPGPLDSIHDVTFWSIDRCFGNSADMPEACPSTGFDQYAADLEAIWAKIFELRSGKPTILRAMDSASPFVSRWNEKQIFNACTVCWEAYSNAARRAAETYHVPFLSRYDIYNGMNHSLDVGQQGYVGGDGIHPNNLAQQHTAELLAQLGYEAVIPP